MKRRRNRVACARNNRWYERYGRDGYFCLPRALLFNVVDYIDNATLYAYIALASCHYEENTTYAGPHVAKLTGKDTSAVRGRRPRALVSTGSTGPLTDRGPSAPSYVAVQYTECAGDRM